MLKEPVAPCDHVLLNGLDVEVRGQDAAHMKELVAVTCRGSRRDMVEYVGTVEVIQILFAYYYVMLMLPSQLYKIPDNSFILVLRDND